MEPLLASYNENTSPSILQKKDTAAPIDKVPKVPPRWYEVISLHMAGKSVKEISAITKYSLNRCYVILENPRSQAIKQQMLSRTQQEMEALYSIVVNNLREQLTNGDDQVKLAAQHQWLKANGKYTPKDVDPSKQLTAEEVVAKLLQINVTINT